MFMLCRLLRFCLRAVASSKSGCRPKCHRFLRKHGLLVANLVAIVLGLVLGFALRPANLSSDTIMWIGLWGELFISMVRMLILPIIFVNLVMGVSSLEAKASGRLGGVTMAYIIITQVIGCIIGIGLGLAIRPGSSLAKDSVYTPPDTNSNYGDVFADLLRNLFPSNIIQAAFRQVQTVRTVTVTPINSTLNDTREVRELRMIESTNTIGVTVFSLLVGFGAFAAGDVARPFLDMMAGLNAIIFWMMKLVTWYSPLGITSLIAASILRVENLAAAMESLGMYILCTLVGCVIHQVIFLHPLYFILIRKNPYKFHVTILDGLLASFSPPAQVAGLAYLFKTVEEKHRMDRRVTKFYLPIAITMNRDMSVMFICVSALFCAQSYGVELDPGRLVAVILMVTALSFAIASVPSSSVVMLLMLTSIVRVPIADRVGLIMAAEWINDRLRTQGNFASTAFGCAIVERLVKKHLPKEDPDHERKLSLASDNKGYTSDETLSEDNVLTKM